jgi:CMP-N-acetylneuraminic acid synthetase
LRNKNDIDCAIKTLVRKKTFADSLVSIGKICLEHPAYAKKINRRGLLKSYCNNNVAHSRQLLKSAYFPYGVIYLSKVNAIKKHNSVYAGRILPFYIERWQNYEINDIYDFITVEKIMQYRKENEKRN